MHKMARTKWVAVISAVSSGTALLSMPAWPQDAAGICPALTHIVDASGNRARFASLHDDPAARPPRVKDAADCRSAANAYDCHWQVQANDEGGASAALQTLGADIAACLPDAVHDVNSPGRQHFYIKRDAGQGNITAATQGASVLRLVVTR